jgi:hypothetical protein
MEAYGPYVRPGASGSRPDHVRAGVARTDDVRAAEQDLEIFSLLTVPLDARFRLDTAVFRNEASRQLHVPRFKLEVYRQTGSTFLLRFEDLQDRNSSLHRGRLEFGYHKFRLMPWRRQVSASSASKMLYCVRLCIEGVPAHLRRARMVTSLFPPTSFIDDRECDVEKAEEEECLRLWLWTSAPEEIAVTGTLMAGEPVRFPEEHYANGGAHLVEIGMPMGVMRLGPAETLDYDVIAHIDRVHEYSSLPDSPSHKSMDSDTSGLPDDELEEEWPVKYRFVWSLGVPDKRPSPVRRRVTVHEWLGGRDRSPPRGGGLLVALAPVIGSTIRCRRLAHMTFLVCSVDVVPSIQVAAAREVAITIRGCRGAASLIRLGPDGLGCLLAMCSIAWAERHGTTVCSAAPVDDRPTARHSLALCGGPSGRLKRDWKVAPLLRAQLTASCSVKVRAMDSGLWTL